MNIKLNNVKPHYVIYHVNEPLILEPEDHTPEEWAFLENKFGMKEASRIVVSNYTLEAFGVPENELAQFDINKREKTSRCTVGKLKEILSKFPDEATVYCCGTKHFYVHVAEDDSYISLDYEDLDEVYTEQDKC